MQTLTFETKLEVIDKLKNTMILGFLFKTSLLYREYKLVGDGSLDWALVVVILIIIIGAEINAKHDKSNP